MSDSPDRTRSAERSARASIDLSTRDLTLDIARVFCVVLVVVIHLLMVGVGFAPDGELVISRPLENQSWFWIATWIGQIMPLFFVVGGFASLTAWRSTQRRGGTAAQYVRNRVLRLVQPALPLFLFYVVVVGAATIIGIDPDLLDAVIAGAGFPLWFLAAYTLCQAFVPIMARLHATRPRLTLLALLAGVVIVDVIHFGDGLWDLGYINFFFVWLLVQQFGFWYADGWFAARTGWQLFGIAAGAYVVMAAVTLPEGWYANDMLANLNPPTLPLVCLAVAQACILRALRPVLSRLMNTHAARAVVFLVGTRLMTIYLWHLPLIIALSGIALLIPAASPAPSSPAWWLSRPIMFVIVFAALFGLSFLVGRWEAPREISATPPATIVALAAVLAFVPAMLVTRFYLDLPLAIVGSACFAIAILVLGRWRVQAVQVAS